MTAPRAITAVFAVLIAMRIEAMSQRMFLIGAAGLLAATLAFVAVRHSHVRPPEVAVVDVQVVVVPGVPSLQVDLDALDARIAKVPTDDTDAGYISHARRVELEQEVAELRARIAAHHK
jgi:hypothetical protein